MVDDPSGGVNSLRVSDSTFRDLPSLRRREGLRRLNVRGKPPRGHYEKMGVTVKRLQERYAQFISQQHDANAFLAPIRSSQSPCLELSTAFQQQTCSSARLAEGTLRHPTAKSNFERPEPRQVSDKFVADKMKIQRYECKYRV
jgi:hypothetical protein